jgi:nucleoside-diphosphate-sugar epimerase
MTVLVTGASGLIGRHTVAHLLARGERVRTFQRHPPGADNAALGQPHGELAGGSAISLEHVRGDVRTDLELLCAAARGCRAIVHLAGRGDVNASRRDPTGYAQLNATGALHALEAARANQAVFVLASSQRVYPLRPELCREDDPPAPDSPYGYGKWVAELWCRMASEHFGVTTRVLRFFSVYGPGQQANSGSGVVSIFAAAALVGKPLVVQSAGRRDFTDARDVARGIDLALAAPADGVHRVYNIATSVGTRFRELADLVVELTGHQASIEEQITEPVGRDLVADISRARTELGYAPCIELRDGLHHYLQWLRQNSF